MRFILNLKKYNKKILISGYYGFDNFGDEAILQTLVNKLKSYNCKIKMVKSKDDVQYLEYRFFGRDIIQFRTSEGFSGVVSEMETPIEYNTIKKVKNINNESMPEVYVKRENNINQNSNTNFNNNNSNGKQNFVFVSREYNDNGEPDIDVYLDINSFQGNREQFQCNAKVIDLVSQPNVIHNINFQCFAMGKLFLSAYSDQGGSWHAGVGNNWLYRIYEKAITYF